MSTKLLPPLALVTEYSTRDEGQQFTGSTPQQMARELLSAMNARGIAGLPPRRLPRSASAVGSRSVPTSASSSSSGWTLVELFAVVVPVDAADHHMCSARRHPATSSTLVQLRHPVLRRQPIAHRVKHFGSNSLDGGWIASISVPIMVRQSTCQCLVNLE